MTNRICLVDNRINEYKVFMNSTLPNVYSIMIDINTTCMVDIMNKIKKLKLNSIESIAYVAHASFKNVVILHDLTIDISDTTTVRALTDFLIYMKSNYGLTYFDFLGCNLASNDNWLKVFSELTDKSHVHIRASTDATGNLNVGGDWILELGDVDANALYFSSNITNFTELLIIEIYRNPLIPIITFPKEITNSTGQLYYSANAIDMYKYVSNYATRSSYSVPPSALTFIPVSTNATDFIEFTSTTKISITEPNRALFANATLKTKKTGTVTFKLTQKEYYSGTLDTIVYTYAEVTVPPITITIVAQPLRYARVLDINGSIIETYTNLIPNLSVNIGQTIGEATCQSNHLVGLIDGVAVEGKFTSSNPRFIFTTPGTFKYDITFNPNANTLYASFSGPINLIVSAPLLKKETFDTTDAVLTTSSPTNWYVYYNSGQPLIKCNGSSYPTLSLTTETTSIPKPRYLQFSSNFSPIGSTAYLVSPVFSISIGIQYITVTFDFCNDKNMPSSLDFINIGLISNASLLSDNFNAPNKPTIINTPSDTNLLSNNLNRYSSDINLAPADGIGKFNSYSVSFMVNNVKETLYNAYIKFTSGNGYSMNVDNIIITNSSTEPVTATSFNPIYTKLVIDSSGNQSSPPPDLSTYKEIFYDGYDINGKRYKVDTSPTVSGWYKVFAQLTDKYVSNIVYFYKIINVAGSVIIKSYETFNGATTGPIDNTSSWYVYKNSSTQPLIVTESPTYPLLNLPLLPGNKCLSYIVKDSTGAKIITPINNTAYLVSNRIDLSNRSDVSDGNYYITITFDFFRSKPITEDLEYINIGCITYISNIFIDIISPIDYLASIATASPTNLLIQPLTRYSINATENGQFYKCRANFMINFPPWPSGFTASRYNCNIYIKFTSQATIVKGRNIHIDNLVISESLTPITGLSAANPFSFESPTGITITTPPTSLTSLQFESSKIISDFEKYLKDKQVGINLKIYYDSDALYAVDSNNFLSFYNYTSSNRTAIYYVTQTVNDIESYSTKYEVTLITPNLAAWTILFFTEETIGTLIAWYMFFRLYSIENSTIKVYLMSAGPIYTKMMSDTLLMSQYDTKNRVAIYYLTQTVNNVESSPIKTTIKITTRDPVIPINVSLTFNYNNTIADLKTRFTDNNVGVNLKIYSSMDSVDVVADTTYLGMVNHNIYHRTSVYYVTQTISYIQSIRVAFTITITPPVVPILVTSSLNFDSLKTIDDFTKTIKLAGANLSVYADLRLNKLMPVNTLSLYGNYSSETRIKTLYVTQTINNVESDTTEYKLTLSTPPIDTPPITTPPIDKIVLKESFTNSATINTLIGRIMSKNLYNIPVENNVTIYSSIDTTSYDNYVNKQIKSDVLLSSLNYTEYIKTASNGMNNAYYYATKSINGVESPPVKFSMELQTPTLTTSNKKGSSLLNYDTSAKISDLITNITSSSTYQSNHIIRIYKKTTDKFKIDNYTEIISTTELSPLLCYASNSTGSITANTNPTYYVTQTLNFVESQMTIYALTLTTPTPILLTLSIFDSIDTISVFKEAIKSAGTDLKIYSESAKTTNLTSSTDVLSTYNYNFTNQTATYYVSQTINSIESKTTEYILKLTSPALKGTFFLTYNNNSVFQALQSDIAIANNTDGFNINIYSDNVGTKRVDYQNLLSVYSDNYVESTKMYTYYVSQSINKVKSPIRIYNIKLVAPELNNTQTNFSYDSSSTIQVLRDTIQKVNNCVIKIYSDNIGTIPVSNDTFLTTYNYDATKRQSIYYCSRYINSIESIITKYTITLSTPATFPRINNISFSYNNKIADLILFLKNNGTQLKIYVSDVAEVAVADTVFLGANNNYNIVDNTTYYYVSQTINTIESPRTKYIIDLKSPDAPTINKSKSLTYDSADTISTFITKIKLSDQSLLVYLNNTRQGVALGTGVLLASNCASGSKTVTYYVAQIINNVVSPTVAYNLTMNTKPPSLTITTVSSSITISDYIKSILPTNKYTLYTQLLNSSLADDSQYLSYVNYSKTTKSVYYYITQTINGIESSKTKFTITLSTPAPTTVIYIPPFNSSNTVSDLKKYLTANKVGIDLKIYSDALGNTTATSTKKLSSTNQRVYYITQTINSVESLITAYTITLQ